MSESGRSGAAVVGGAVLSLAVVYWVATGDQTPRVDRHLAVYFGAFAAYVLGVFGLAHRKDASVSAGLALAVVWRLALLGAPPLLSDDVNRYVWEGRIQNHGGNPYAWDDRPESPKWTPLRDDVWRGINHKEYTAIYPPAWQLAARAVTAVHDSVFAMKAFLALCEVGAMALMAVLLGARELPLGRLILWAWNPLSLVEIAGSGHNEALGLLWLVAGLVALEAPLVGLSSIAMTLGMLSKFLPGLVAIAWFRRYRPLQALVPAALCLVCVWPYLGSTEGGLSMSLEKYSRYWRFNETIFALVAACLPSHEAAVRACAAFLVLFAFWLGMRKTEPSPALLGVVVATILLSPNVLPWYALWLLPALVVGPAPGALAFTGTVALAYSVYPSWLSGAEWQVGWALRAVEYVPCLLIMAMPRKGSPPRGSLPCAPPSPSGRPE